MNMNKTNLFLKEQIKLYPNNAMLALKNIAISNYFIGDTEWYYTTETRKIQNYLFLVVCPSGEFDNNKKIFIGDVTDNQNKFSKNLDVLKSTKINDEPILITSYKLKNSALKRVLVLNLPITNSVSNFIQSKFSKIYTKQEIEKLFPKSNVLNRDKQRGVLLKEDEYKKIFLNSLNKKFNTSIRVEEFDSDEYELPVSLEMSTEWLNYDNYILTWLGLESLIKK